MAIRIQRVSAQTFKQEGLFSRIWDTAAGLIESLLTSVGLLETAVTTAQTTANTAVTAAATAQTTANTAVSAAASAQATADTAVQQDETDPWQESTGTFERTAYTTYTGVTFGGTYGGGTTQADLTAMSTEVQDISRRLGALINDLRLNGTITSDP